MKRVIYLFILMTTGVSGWASPLTLGEVVKEVKRSHPAIAEAKEEENAARSSKHAEAWLPDPKMGILFEEVASGESNLKNADMTNYSVSQEIPFLGTLITRGKAGEAEVQARKSLTTGVEREKIFEAKKTFYELIANSHHLQNRKKILASYQLLAASLEKEYESGGDFKPQDDAMGRRNSQMTSDSLFSDLMMAKMKKAEAEAQIYDLQHQDSALKARLNLIMGREATTPIPNLEIPKIRKLPFTAEELEAKLLNQNSDLTAKEWMIKKAKKEKSLATQALIPTLEPEWTYHQRENRDNAYSLGVKLNIPLWLNRNAAEISRAKHLEKKAVKDWEKAQLDFKTELHYLIHHATEHGKIVKKYQSEIVPLAESAYRSSLAAFEAGQIPSSSLLPKLVGADQAKNMYWEMWADYMVEYALLEEMVGEEL